MNCPKCIGKLNKITVKLNEVYRAESLKGEGIVQELELDQCFVCNGVWFDAGELDKYIAEKVTIVNSPSIDESLRKEHDVKIAKCPRCNVDMTKKKAPRDERIIIDFCETCRGVWLDNSEIDKIEEKGGGWLDRVKSALGSLVK